MFCVDVELISTTSLTSTGGAWMWGGYKVVHDAFGVTFACVMLKGLTEVL